MPQRIDIQHHEPRHVAGYLDEALAILDARELPPEERVAVLATLVTLISSKSVQIIPDTPLPMPAMAIPRNSRH